MDVIFFPPIKAPRSGSNIYYHPRNMIRFFCGTSNVLLAETNYTTSTYIRLSLSRVGNETEQYSPHDLVMTDNIRRCK